MRFAGRESWQVEHGTNPAVNTALFLRDTLALSVDTEPELPGLEPSVPVIVPARRGGRATSRSARSCVASRRGSAGTCGRSGS